MKEWKDKKGKVEEKRPNIKLKKTKNISIDLEKRGVGSGG